ncbi:Mucin-associated surface protein (MASP) [Trypanosoma cruzi]|uniref:Mucin-associated surface protein (MASP), putative n=2 Tax=Trypanosoma cruzi TaxID=5693 RepID=Q4CPC4_TRYCC|nr:mucin-associated surface protein (MASP), putative [Trypanosoma cruzi]EAN82126.1 mucin-associated surface protein (MASP), putative [Trypanosoma cruzi]PWV20643.1 Mucin-associated surface protein (MASP) [Trypanosoma cruzi]|eukprot:XP_803977.1 mucin-associated surface protein (MASP) [Trypanosoma cruzi strain CL Brener]
MAMMMTGRVLLVCALCVLWCGAGDVYAGDLDNRALGGCMASGVLGMNASYVPNGCNEYMPTPPLRSALPIPAIQAEDGQVRDTAPGSGSGVGEGGGSPGALSPAGAAASGSAPAPVAPVAPAGPVADPTADPPGGSAATGPAAAPGSPVSVPGPVAGPGGNAGSSPGVHAPPHIDDTVITSSDLSSTREGSREEALQQKETESHDPSSSKGLTQEALPDVQQSQISTSENIKTGCGEEASNCEDEQSVEKATLGKKDLTVAKAQKPPATQNTKSKDNEENSTEASSTESENTEPQQEIKTPVDESDSTSTDASTAVAARSTSAGSQEEATASSSNGSHSPLQGEVFTGTDTPENAPSPAAAETEKRQGENVTTPGDSDSSPAASHTTSPLLLVVVACAAAAAVVAA